MSLEGKVALVTGASSGIGAAIAVALSGAGARVALTARRRPELTAVAVKCPAETLVVVADVADPQQAEEAVRQTIERFGKLDILINNAGIVRFGSILGGNFMESYDEIMRINLRAVVHLTNLTSQYLVETKGNIVNISSIAATICPKSPEMIAYHTSKAALDHFSRGAALELAPKGVRVNVVSPGPVMTNIAENSKNQDLLLEVFASLKVPLNRYGEPEEIADLVLFLVSDKARSITGAVFVSDNGVKLD